MIFTTETFAKYLGNEASILLGELPFRGWGFERSIDDDLDEPRIDYVAMQHGMDFICGEDDKVRTIFLYSDESRRFKHSLQDLPFTSNRQKVLERFGSPSKSGDPLNDPILGKYGAWDRFSRSDYVIHIEYQLDDSGIRRVTLMTAATAP